MKLVELREKNRDELLIVCDDLKKDIHQQRMDLAIRKTQDHAKIKKSKKDLARVMTVLREKQV